MLFLFPRIVQRVEFLPLASLWNFFHNLFLYAVEDSVLYWCGKTNNTLPSCFLSQKH
jgi:hypothetical protein